MENIVDIEKWEHQLISEDEAWEILKSKGVGYDDMYLSQKVKLTKGELDDGLAILPWCEYDLRESSIEIRVVCNMELAKRVSIFGFCVDMYRKKDESEEAYILIGLDDYEEPKYLIKY